MPLCVEKEGGPKVPLLTVELELLEIDRRRDSTRRRDGKGGELGWVYEIVGATRGLVRVEVSVGLKKENFGSGSSSSKTPPNRVPRGV